MSDMNRRQWLKVAAVTPVLAATGAGAARAAAPTADDVKGLVDKALGFLKGAQKDDGHFLDGGFAEPGLTALVAASLARNGVPADNPVVSKAVKYLEKNVKDDGGVYLKGLSNYMTCLAIVAFKEVNADKKYDKVIESASKYVKGLQYADGLTEKDLNFGGAGYDKPGAKGGPDLSNTHFMVEALLAAGVSKDDPAIKRALTYISRCQNFESEANKFEFAAKAGAAD
ncbi:MAG: terpene cyclase/mutase family protein, partial [Gemmataceae bacterium]|nr:terpene cyclase/mutase family protein [Gemmataceae bacterium]